MWMLHARDEGACPPSRAPRPSLGFRYQHNYERCWPTLNGTVTKSYDQPGKPVHVVTGAGGAYSKDEFGDAGPWDAFRSSEWSWSDISVNRTHFVLKQRLATNSSVIDSFTLSR